MPSVFDEFNSFVLVPVGAKEEPKSAYNNARIENLEKWPWKLSLGHRCVVPLLAFREPCYWGETEGTEAYFAPCDDSTLWVAALFNEWRGAITMTSLMRPACAYVMEHGHHRQPIFIKLDGIDECMQPGKRLIDELKDILRRNTDEPELTHMVDRQMAASWKSRQSSRLKKRDEQLAELEKSMLPLGFLELCVIGSRGVLHCDHRYPAKNSALSGGGPIEGAL